MASTALAQQTVPFEGGRPVLPRGLPIPPLPEEPVVYETAEGQDIRVSVVASGLEWPYSLAFLPDGGIVVTERVGNLRIIRDGVLDPEPVPGGPPAYFIGQSGVPGAYHGYMDIALHPDFEDNRFIYLTYTKLLANDEKVLALARGVWTGSALVDVEDIFIPNSGGRSRIAFAPDGTLFMSTNGAGSCASRTMDRCRPTTLLSVWQAMRPRCTPTGRARA
jgi:glucose/arabinose dehydrogenase